MNKNKRVKKVVDPDEFEQDESGVTLRPVYVPVDLHSKVKAKTAAKGLSLKSVIIELIEDYLQRP